MKNISRTYKPTDLAARAGITAAVGAISLCLLLSSAPITYGTSLPDAMVNSSSDLQIALRWIQPILGHAIVEDALIRQLVGNEHRTNGVNSPVPALAFVGVTEVDHASRVQWVMGRLIVELTRHRMRIPDGPADEGNQRIIIIAQQVREKLNGAFRSDWHAGLGQAIVTKAINQERTTQHGPEIGLIS